MAVRRELWQRELSARGEGQEVGWQEGQRVTTDLSGGWGLCCEWGGRDDDMHHAPPSPVPTL